MVANDKGSATKALAIVRLFRMEPIAAMLKEQDLLKSWRPVEFLREKDMWRGPKPLR